MILWVITLHVLPTLTGAQAHCQATCLGLFGYLLTLLFFLFQCSPNTVPLSHLIGGFAFHCELWGEQVYCRRRGNWYCSSGPGPGGSGPGRVRLVDEGWSWHCCISAQIALAGDVENTGCGGLSPSSWVSEGRRTMPFLDSQAQMTVTPSVFGPFFHIAPFLLQETGDMRVNHSHAGCWEVPMVVWGDTGQHKCPVQATSG